jgi:ABC-type antimicrobial peptide transport system permease subunit
VTSDFHFASMQGAIDPMIFFNVNFAPTYRYFSFKLKPGDIAGGIAAIQKKWAILLPGSAFEYKFMDDTLAKLYATELQLKKAAYAAAFLSLVIVLLGVLGLVSLNIQKRVKEIGIRKVLGASLSNIASLFIKEFIFVILIAGAVAFPVAWYIMSKWLNSYNYRINIGMQPFIAAILVLGAITLLLIALQVVKAVRNNPVKNLRTE